MIVAINGEYTVKRLRRPPDCVWLEPDNRRYRPIRIGKGFVRRSYLGFVLVVIRSPTVRAPNWQEPDISISFFVSPHCGQRGLLLRHLVLASASLHIATPLASHRWPPLHPGVVIGRILNAWI